MTNGLAVTMNNRKKVEFSQIIFKILEILAYAHSRLRVNPILALSIYSPL